jgi:hypothetical protein
MKWFKDFLKRLENAFKMKFYCRSCEMNFNTDLESFKKHRCITLEKGMTKQRRVK